MRRLSDYITEKLKINNSTNTRIYHPMSRDELIDLIYDLISERGNDADLNDIDVSEIKDMSEMFWHSKFNGDISNWDVSKVEDMSYMFRDSKFNGDISKWDVKNVSKMNHMFADSIFNKDISDWDVSNVTNMKFMFLDSKFNQDISKWNVQHDCETYSIFWRCPLQNNPPAWYEKFK